MILKKHLNFFGDSREQHDSQEFLTALLDLFHENLKIQCVIPTEFSDEIKTLLKIDFAIDEELKSLHVIKEQMDQNKLHGIFGAAWYMSTGFHIELIPL